MPHGDGPLRRGRPPTELLVLGAAVALLAALSVEPARAAAKELIQFELADQFDRTYSDAELRGRVAVVISSGRRGSRYQGEWSGRLGRAIAGRSDDALLVEVADLRGVPFFMKGSVKKKFPEERGDWVLMDWKGVIARAYELDPDRCTVLLFDRAGSLVHRASGGEPTPAELAAVLDRLDAELADR